MRDARSLLAALLVLVGGLLAGSGTSQAASVTVVVDQMAFSPAVRTVAQGTTVTWDFRESGHNTASRQGFWRSAFLAPGSTYARSFPDAGRFAYWCQTHGPMGMTGAVVVPLRRSGTSSGGWTLRWSSRTSTPSSRRWDVQVRAPGSSTWKAFRTDTRARSASFDPAGSGTYAFRARTDDRSSGQSSGWSPVMSVPVT